MLRGVEASPSSYSSVEAACIYCGQLVKLQILRKTFAIRCPRCSRSWGSAREYCELVAVASGREQAERLFTLLANSVRASGGTV